MFLYFAIDFGRRFIDKKSQSYDRNIINGTKVKQIDQNKMRIFAEIINEFVAYSYKTLDKINETHPEIYSKA